MRTDPSWAQDPAYWGGIEHRGPNGRRRTLIARNQKLNKRMQWVGGGKTEELAPYSRSDNKKKRKNGQTWQHTLGIFRKTPQGGAIRETVRQISERKEANSTLPSAEDMSQEGRGKRDNRITNGIETIKKKNGWTPPYEKGNP